MAITEPQAGSDVGAITCLAAPEEHGYRRNDIECIALEKKLEIHASPTCVMNFGPNEGALGWLVEKPHNVLTKMFTMMNTARLAIGNEGLGIAERAYQQAKSYAQIRYQGKDDNNKSQKIVEYPDVKRMLVSKLCVHCVMKLLF